MASIRRSEALVARFELSTPSENYLSSLSAEGRYRLLVEAITDYAIYMLDAQGRVANWNAGAARFKRYRADEVVGQNFAIFYTEEDRASGLPEQNLRRAAEEGRVEQEGWRLRKDGARFWAHVVIDRILGPDGGLMGFAKITRDLTERRESQRQLEQAREALFQAQKLEAIGQLTGGIAHDFNNLLMAILGSLEIVQRRMNTDDALTPFIENAVKGARRGTALTQRMLAFARRQELKVSDVDITPLMADLCEMMERSLGPSVLLSVQVPPGLPQVKTDPVQLENAVLNLVVNSRDAMPHGGSIVISGHLKSPPAGSRLKLDRYVVLAVEDDGEGMDEATLTRAAEPFFTTKDVGHGTGLGLAMVHGLAEQSGGTLLLSSKKGFGTRAEIWLPVSDDQATATQNPDPELVHEGRKLLVLAIDDDALVLLNTVAMLEELGHEVASAYSALEALEIVDQQSIDLVISDQGMPQMTGLQFIDALERKGHRIPTIIATGYADVVTDRSIKKLAKPFSLGDLEAAIADLNLV